MKIHPYVEPSNSRAETIVVVPGMGMEPRHYETLAHEFVRAGFDTAIAEYSADALARNMTTGQIAELIAEQVAATSWPTGLKQRRYVFVGHSLGGRIALRISACRPDSLNIAATVTVGSSIPYWRDYPSGHRLTHLLRTQAMYLVARVCGKYPGTKIGFGGDQPLNLIHELAFMSRTGQIMSMGHDLNEIACPVLTITLDGDHLAPDRSVERLTQRLPRMLVTHAIISRQDGQSDRSIHNGWMKEARPVVEQVSTWLDSAGRNPVSEALAETGMKLAHVRVSNPDEPLSAEAMNELATVLRQAHAVLEKD